MKIKIILMILIVLALDSCAFINRQAKMAALAKQKFTVNINSPNVEAGEIEAQFNRAFPLTGVAKHDVKITYYPFEDAVCLQYRINTVTYNQFWHRAGRNAFVTAMKKYNEDFANQKLNSKNNNKTKTQYGAVGGFYLVWYPHRFSVQSRGNMEMYFGYYFRENSPFFAVTQMEAFFQSPSLDKERDEYSPEVPIFFTRAQAEELAEIFDQEYLQGIIPNEYIQALNRAARRTDDTADFDNLN